MVPRRGRVRLYRYYRFRTESVGRHSIPTVGETLAAGDVFGSIEAVKTVSDAFLPVGGEVVEFNDAVDADPALVNSDPYGEGWMIKVKMNNPADYDALLTPEAYTELIG